MEINNFDFFLVNDGHEDEWESRIHAFDDIMMKIS